MRWRPHDHVPFELDAACQRFVLEHPQGAPHEDVAQVLGLTPRRIAQIEAQALAKLARALWTDEGSMRA